MIDVRKRLEEAGLTKMQVMCLALQFWDGLTQKQISGRLRISQQAVAEHLGKSRELLRKARLKPRPMKFLWQPTVVLETPHWLDELGPDEVKVEW